MQDFDRYGPPLNSMWFTSPKQGKHEALQLRALRRSLPPTRAESRPSMFRLRTSNTERLRMRVCAACPKLRRDETLVFHATARPSPKAFCSGYVTYWHAHPFISDSSAPCGSTQHPATLRTCVATPLWRPSVQAL